MARGMAARPARRAAVTPALLAALLRRLRGEGALAGTVVAVVLVTSLIAAAVPRLFNGMSQDGLVHAISHAAVYERNIVASKSDTIPAAAGGDVFAGVDAAGAAFQANLAPPIAAVIDHRRFVVDALRYNLPVPSPPSNLHLTLRYQSGVEERLKVVEGRLPAPTGETVAAPNGEPAPLFEVAMSPETAAALGVKLGQRVVLAADTSDRLIPFRGAPPPPLAIAVVGLTEPVDPTDDYWYGDPRLWQPSVYDDGNTTQVYATALFAARAYPALQAATQPALFTYTWRYFVDPGRFRASQVGPLTAEARRLDATYGSAFTSRVGDVGVTTGLTSLLTRFLAQRRLTESMLSLAAIGLLTVAITVLGLLAAFIAERRRDLYLLTRGRGASTAQLAGAGVAEGLLLSLPPALAGYLLAVALVRAEPSRWSLAAAGGIALVTTALLVAMALPFIRRDPRTLEREEVRRGRFSARRAALETFVVVLAAAGIYLLRRRGLAGDAATARAGGFDPYLAAVPLLLGLATGLVVLRLYPLPVRFAAWVASLGNDLVPFLGLRRVARQSAVTSVPLLVLLLAVAAGVFSSVLLHTIEVGQTNTSWQRAGADYRVDALPNTELDPRLDLGTARGVEATAAAYQESALTTSIRGNVGQSLSVLAVQPAAYQEVTAGTPAETHFPAPLLATPAGATGTAANPIPAVVSRDFAAGASLGPGDTFALVVRGRSLSFVVVEARERFAGLPVGTPFLVAPLDWLDAATPGRPSERNRVYLRAPAGSAGAIAEALDAGQATARLMSRAAEFAAIHDSPLIAGATRGFRLGIVIAAAYSALAVIVALALTARARARDIGYLRTLGLAPRQVLALTAVEQAPPVVLALLAGTALGLGIIRLVEPGLDFTAFTGPDVPVRIAIDWGTVMLLGLGLVAIVAAAVALVSRVAERMQLSGVLRLGDQ